MTQMKQVGSLYVVATPIGNLQDITFRAIHILHTVNCIAAEDTRHSFTLLQHYGIKTPRISLHEHNEKERTTVLLDRLLSGESIALITDAGTPLISDPGYFLVHHARMRGIPVVPIPGPCAAIAALSASGLPSDHFVFEGFLPKKSKQRKERFSFLAQETRTMILYEAPHRILGLLRDLNRFFGEDRPCVLARELTKTFETLISGTLHEVLLAVEKDANQKKGEMVLVISGSPEKPVIPQDISPSNILTILLSALHVKEAVELTSKITGERKNKLYQMAILAKKA